MATKADITLDKGTYHQFTIFVDEDDNNIKLTVIRGLENPIDIDAEEEERNNNETDPINSANSKATDPKELKKQKKAK